MFKHPITYYRQPTNHSCGQAGLAMLLSFFGETYSPNDMCALVPVCKNENGEDAGSITQHLAIWCLQNGYDVNLYTSDFELVDLSWGSASKAHLLSRLELAKHTKTNTVLGRYWSEVYLQSYIDFIHAGGQLHILPYMSAFMIRKLLTTSPLLVCVNFNVLHTQGRQVHDGHLTSKLDDINGKLANHYIVLQGINDQGKFIYCDSWESPGEFEIDPEHLICAITAAQIESDSIYFQLEKRAKKANQRS